MPRGPIMKVNGRNFSFTFLSNGCFECISRYKDKYGYPKVHADGKTTTAHRFIYEKIYGAVPKGIVIRHTCDNPSCINPLHLIPGTDADNNRDKAERGRAPHGINQWEAKLNDEKVRFIRSNPDLTHKKLAEMYGVSSKAIQKVRKQETWKHVV